MASEQLAWLRQATQEARGDVKTSAFNQVDVINREGVYTVGLKDKQVSYNNDNDNDKNNNNRNKDIVFQRIQNCTWNSTQGNEIYCFLPMNSSIL